MSGPPRAPRPGGKPSGKSGGKAGGRPEPFAGKGGAPASFMGPQLRTWFLLSLVVLVIGWGVTAWNVARPLGSGDGGEYFTQLQGWRSHGSPDLRPADGAAVTAMAKRNGYDDPHPALGFFKSPRDGRWYSWHFWGYSLAALPVRMVVDAGRANPMMTFGLLNGLLFFATFIAAAGVARASGSPHALVWWTLCAGSPLLWYLRWATPEVWTWATLFGALLCLDARRYTLGAFLAALAAWQNPPALFVAWWFVAIVLADKNRSPRLVLPVVGAALLCFVPNAFYLLFYGKSSLIFAKAYRLDFSLISLPRVGSILFDLNMGMLPYVPVILALTAWALVRTVRDPLQRKPVDGLALAGFGVLAAMVAVCCLNAHWNVGEAGMRRYTTWMLPLWVWLMLRGLDLNAARPVLYGALLWQIALFASHDGSNYSLGHTPWARWVLVHAPSLYNPEPLVFTDRSPRRGVPAAQAVPVAVLDGSGNATKILVSRGSLPELNRQFEVNQRWLGMQKIPSGLVYLDPPPGAVFAKTGTRKKYAEWVKEWETW